MGRFFNRRDELEALEERWSSPRAEFVVIYGRRRVGKSHLIAHFAAQRRHLLFEATAGTERDHLDDLSKEIARVSGRRLYEEQPLSSWRAAFAALEELLDDGPILIAIDEFQFAARRNQELGSLINTLMRDHKDDPRLRLLIAGSDVSFFEKEVVGYAATSYGRRTGSLHVEPFTGTDIRPFVPDWSVEDRIRAWAVFGGVPYYLDEIDPERDLAANILRAVLVPDGLLRSEPEFLLAQESRIRDRAVYMSALRAIAGGATRLGEIAARLQRRPEEARTFLETLEEMRLVRRRYPITQAGGRKVLYAITDPFLRFWFRFVAPYESRLQTRASARGHLEETVLPELDHFVSRDAFEEVCQQWMLRHVPEAVEVGRWWGSRRERHAGRLHSRQYEADVVPVDASRRVLALGSCKWSVNEHGAEELDKLETIVKLLGETGTPLYFFDRTGFSPRLQQLGRDRDDVHLVAVADVDTI
ncbi:MAG TPA: ATP-binding protein [Solirubrobacter sp.]|nr:ATP-binding protein [Solirubrobacter sp.]